MTEDARRTSAAERMAASIEKVVRESPALEELQRAGTGLVVLGDHHAVVLRTDPPPGSRWPVLQASVKGETWWSPEGMYRAEQLASRLAAELRMKWDRWVAGA